MTITRIISTIAAIAVALLAAATDKIEWINTEYDFGAFDESVHLAEAQFRFINVGDVPVSITTVNATCGCTTPEFSRDPILPGDTATITVSYDAEGRPGRFEKILYVRTTAEANRRKLTLSGVVIGSDESVRQRFPIDLGPLKLRNAVAMLGSVPSGHSKMGFLSGYNRSTRTITPIIVSQPRYLQLSAVPTDVPPGEQMEFGFYFMSDRCDLYGIVADSVVIDVEGTQYAIPFTAIVEEDFSRLTPGQMQKAPVASLEADRVVIPADSDTSTLRLTNRGKDPLKIRRIYTQDPGISAQISARTIKKNKSATITITIDPAVIPAGQPINARVTLITNDPTNPTQTIRVVGER